MSKICDRNYKANQAYTVKMINGVGCCPLCEKPAKAHGKSIEYRTLIWLLSDDTGVSSKAIARHMALGHDMGYSSPPSDSSDRGRCIRLLELIPEWINRLGEMRQYDNTKQPTGITITGSGITADRNTWTKQIPLIMQEGKL